VSIGSASKRGRKKDEAEQTTCVALATLVQLSNRHFRYLNSLRAGNICLFRDLMDKEVPFSPHIFTPSLQA